MCKYHREECHCLGFLHQVTDICHNKTFITRVRSVFFRRPWRNLKERSFSLLRRGMTKKYLKTVIQRNRSWLQTFHGPQRTALPCLYIWLIQVDSIIWIQYDYGDCNCIEQDLPRYPRKSKCGDTWYVAKALEKNDSSKKNKRRTKMGTSY